MFSATEYHLGLLKAKLAKCRQQLLEPTGKPGAKVVIISLLDLFDSSTGKNLYLTYSNMSTYTEQAVTINNTSIGESVSVCY